MINPPGDVWAGVDVGTQSLRVYLVDAAGAVAGRGSGRLRSHRRVAEDGTRRHEQDPAQWWQVLGEAFRQALAGLDGRAGADRVRGVAFCSTSGTFTLAGPDGLARTPAVMYDDARAHVEAAKVAATGADLWTALGYPMQPSWALPKLVHLLRAGHRGRLQHCADHLAERLAGAPVATDWSHALKTGYDVAAGTWPSPVLDRLGVPADMLPDVVRPGHRIGAVGAAGAAHTGLTVGTPIHAGLTDGCAAQAAAGALTPGSWNSVLGTTLVLKGVTTERLRDPGGAVYSHRHPDGGWLPGGASNVGAGVLDARFPGADQTALDAAAAAYEPAAGLSYPLLSKGERFPFVDPEAEAFDAGRFSGTAERYAALLQGVALVERLCFAYLQGLGADISGPVTLTGGATRSRYWTQLRADILGRDVILPAHAEPAFGAAACAAAGDGSLTAAAQKMAGDGRVVAHRPEVHERFAEPYAKFVAELHDRGYLERA
ncbi:MAG: carbohydrate kinase [Hamadaea sp.]|nr:carbohydrate kinase [Hamadaea sp.]